EGRRLSGLPERDGLHADHFWHRIGGDPGGSRARRLHPRPPGRAGAAPPDPGHAQRRGPCGDVVARVRSRILFGTAALGAAAYFGVATGRLSVDLGVGRRRRVLGPLELDVDAPRDVVFDVIAQPYLEATP